MASGGARARSGPAKDPNSGRSERLGITFEVLDAAGFQGEPPAFPLTPVDVFFYTKDGERIDDASTSDRRNVREAELWEWAWRLPQAIMWAKEGWRHLAVANWVRLQALCETEDAKAADKTALLRLATQIGLTPEGLALNEWQIGDPAGEESGVERSPRKRKTSRDRMKVVEGGGG